MNVLALHRGEAPLILSIPHTGTDIPAVVEADLVSPWLARKDADWWVERLYDFAADLGATVLRTLISRTVIDVNRDPTGASLYPGAATTELCPTTTFDGEKLYLDGREPSVDEIARRRQAYLFPYHQALTDEIVRLRTKHSRIVLYEAHSIRSRIPRLFDGELPNFNVGTNGGMSCDPTLTAAVESACDASGLSRVTNGRFKGGYITRRFGEPASRVHALQLELACRGYMSDPVEAPAPSTWPSPYDLEVAGPMRETLRSVLNACLAFARNSP